MKNHIAILLLIINFSSFAQTIKTYNGNYENGQATYEYYENSDYERILHGKFSFKSNMGNPSQNINTRFVETTNIIGSFKENKKSGKWDIKKVNTNAYMERTASWKGNFEDGQKNGIWLFNIHTVVDNKTNDIKASFNFNKDQLIGEVIIGDIKGQLDSNGKFIGNWNIKTNDGIEYIAEFKNNIFTKLVARKISDGFILMKYICDSASSYNSMQYEVINCKTIKSSDETHIKDIDTKYFSEFFGQVETIKAIDNSINEIKIGSSPFLILEPQVVIRKKMSYEEIKAETKKKEMLINLTNTANKNFETENYADAMSFYQKAIEIEDNQHLKDKIKDCENKINEDNAKKYNSFVISGDKYFESSNYSMAIIEYKNALKIKREDYPQNQINIAELKIKELDAIEQRRKEEEIEKRKVEMQNKEIIRLESETKLNHIKLLENKTLTKNKKTLNNAYITLYNNSNLINGNDNKTTHLKNLLLLQENISYLINLSSNSLEKELKNVTDSNEIWKIIMNNLKLSWYKVQ